MKSILDIKYLLIFTTLFIVFTAIGTVSHEYGHIAVAKYFGFETILHYGSMNYYSKGYQQDNDVKALNDIKKLYHDIEYDFWPIETKEKFKHYRELINERYSIHHSRKSFFVTLGGPLQTILTGCFGLLIIFIRRKSIQNRGLMILDWLAVFLALFWLREIFNLLTGIGSELISPNGTWFGSGGDEYKLSKYLNLWSGTIPIIMGTLGFVVSVYIIFRIVPSALRLTFILSGLIGGISGFILWMDIIGPKILP